MISTVKLQTLHAALVLVTSFVSAQTPWYPDFQENGRGFLTAGCTNWYAPLESMVLTATCPDGVCAGNMVTSSLDLNECIENSNGNMYWNSSGDFSQTCRYCTIQGDRYMTCHCKDNGGDEKIGLVDLNMGIITNTFGYLSCFEKIDFNRGQHSWPCKGHGWTPFKDSKVIHVQDKPQEILRPAQAFNGNTPNATASTNGSRVFPTVKLAH